MKVLHFYKTYYPESYGGIEQFIYQSAEGFFSCGIESNVLYLSGNRWDREEYCGRHKVYCVPTDFEIASTSFSIKAFSRFKKLALQVDLIHFHFPWPFADLVHLLSGINKPVVVTYHSDIVKQKYLFQLYKPLMHIFLRKADAIVATSSAYRQNSSVLQKYKEKTHIIPLGIDETSYPKASFDKIEEWRKKLPPKFFLFVGALRYYKGLQFLIEAVAKNGLPVVIAGAGDMEMQLRQQVVELNVENVFFIGAVSDVDKVALLNLSMAFVFPSHLSSEAFGISLLEAAMYGKPMISCEIGTGTTFINLHGETGIVVPPADPLALADAMSKLWLDEVLCQRMGYQARLRFVNIFTADRMVNSYANLYRKLIGGNPPINHCSEK